MIPSLLLFTLLASLVLLAIGLPLLLAPDRVESPVRAFPRNRALGIATMLLGGGWFLWKILNLGPSDFGNYRHLLFLLFAATLFGSIYYVRDFLAVRGFAILTLLCANVGLKSAFGHYEIPERLFLVGVLYLFIVAAMYFGTMPYRMRDLLDFLYRRPLRVRSCGVLFTAAGLGLVVSAVLY